MTIERKVELLATLTNRDETGRHFTERYSDSDLGYLEDAGLITIDRPVHEPTGISWGCEHWTVEVTEEGVELVERCPEFHPVA